MTYNNANFDWSSSGLECLNNIKDEIRSGGGNIVTAWEVMQLHHEWFNYRDHVAINNKMTKHVYKANLRNKYPYRNAPWTKDDLRYLLDNYKPFNKTRHLARVLGRTKAAIIAKYARLTA